MKQRLLLTTAALAAALSLFATACTSSDDDNKAAKGSGGDAGIATREAAEVASHYADGVFASYQASVASAEKLNESIKTFITDPTEANMSAAKEAWTTARVDYRPTEAFRFYDGPIDNPENGPEGRINAWPMDEGYVDYVQGPDGIQTVGIINDKANYPEITKDTLVEANEKDGEENISTGWHAIEFLLWGQDLSESGPGERPVTDYTTAENAQRRGEYLGLLGDLLVSDLKMVAQEWDPEGDDNYRSEFLADPELAIAHMFRGIGALTVGELSGERIAVAIETKDQEDEHSCFSDTTNGDVEGNIIGVRNVLNGTYPTIESGPGLLTLIDGADSATAATLTEQIDSVLQLAKEVPAPFDQMVTGDSAPLQAIVDGLGSAGESIAAGAKKLGISVDTGV